ncbi:MAG TPA: flagellar protein export ATPase FliI [Spirochaetes bacterium]|nr:flagellar protein export ATPase FliI [Spirochaetota bacterium]
MVQRIFDKYVTAVEQLETVVYEGTVSKAVGLLIESKGPLAGVGEMCRVILPEKGKEVPAEVVGFKNGITLLFPYDNDSGIKSGLRVVATGKPLSAKVGDALLGRVINTLGKPIDDKGPVYYDQEYPIFNTPPHVLKRRRITEVLATGIKSIDGCLTIGKGQRLGIFSGSGVGKSTLLGMIAKHTAADVNVIALIGERGREVRDFIEGDLGEEGMERSVVVVATSDQAPISRIRGAYLAMAVAEYFRDQGKDVLFMMDSITRFARAQREIGLAVGEPPATKGYTPSVFSILPKLLERSGMAQSGSITGIFTVLVEGDDINEPVSDAVRGVLDGHIVLSRDLAQKNQYPAVDVLASISRLMPYITSEKHKRAIGKLKQVLAYYYDTEDLIQIGAYVKGSDKRIDWAVEKIDDVTRFLMQGVDEDFSFQDIQSGLFEIFDGEGE